MQNISKRLILAIIVVIIALVVGGWFWYEKQKISVEGEIKTIHVLPGQQIPNNQLSETQVSQGNELDSVKSLIDGEYVFEPVDTSDWQVYHNEEMGFKVRIPKDWYVNDLTQSRDSQIADYYKRENEFAVCFGQKGKEYWYEGGKEDALCLFNHKDKSVLNPSKFKEIILGRKEDYHSKISITSVDRYQAIVQDGFGLESYIFREHDYWVLSYSLVGYPEVKAAYPHILKSIKFFN